MPSVRSNESYLGFSDFARSINPRSVGMRCKRLMKPSLLTRKTFTEF